MRSVANLNSASRLRPHLLSAGMAGGYSLLVHLAMWLAISLIYISNPTDGMPYIAVWVATLLVSIGLLILVRSFPPEKVTFYVSLLIGHILLSLLFLLAASPLIAWLDGLRNAAQPPVDSPDGDLEALYFVFTWIFVTPAMGTVYFLAAIISLVRTLWRRKMGYVPKPKRTPKAGSGAPESGQERNSP